MKTHAPKQDRKHATPADAIKVQKTRDFASWKFTIEKAMTADERLTSNAKLVLLRILAHLNEATRYCFPSVELLCIETRLPQRQVERALTMLRNTGWLDSWLQRESFDGSSVVCSHYCVLDDNTNAMLDQLTIDVEAWRESKARKRPGRKPKSAARSMKTDPPRVADRFPTDPPKSETDPPKELGKCNNVNGMQSNNTLIETPSKNSVYQGKRLSPQLSPSTEIEVVETEAFCDGAATERCGPDGPPTYDHDPPPFDAAVYHNDEADDEETWRDRVIGTDAPPGATNPKMRRERRAPHRAARSECVHRGGEQVARSRDSNVLDGAADEITNTETSNTPLHNFESRSFSSVAAHRTNGRPFDQVFHIATGAHERIALEKTLIRAIKPRQKRTHRADNRARVVEHGISENNGAAFEPGEGTP
jgi:hypothetical protein